MRYTVAMKDAVVLAGIDADLKANAAPGLAKIRCAEPEHSMPELQEFKRESQYRDHRIASSADVSKGEMLLLKPERVRGARVRWPKADLV